MDPVVPVADFEGAARLYRACRAEGIAQPGLIDCMIANIALRTGARLLASEDDFDAMTQLLPLPLELDYARS